MQDNPFKQSTEMVGIYYLKVKIIALEHLLPELEKKYKYIIFLQKNYEC